ncbi:MAG: hypothetical protein OXN86_03550 [Chloroflexota bacterium]|nr:hypothetical protein [Chloroflexota bacterium]
MTYDFDLGSHSRPITTSSPDAQLWFDRGLIWTYGFNHDEAVHCFRQAVQADPDCAMAHWGIAYAIGPNYNKPWEAFGRKEVATALTTAHDEANLAVSLSDNCTAAERDLIAALQSRYPQTEPLEDMMPWVDDYADAMRDVYRDHSDDLDIASLFAEAVMNRTPWSLWNLDSGEPADGADTVEARAVLEDAMAHIDHCAEPPHPGILHMYIHLMEMSPFPEQALRAADQLRGIAPHSGHLQHMATHIDVLCGDYLNVVNWNERAIQADRPYLEARGPFNFYTMYRAHNYHFKIYGAMFLGQFQPAIETARALQAAIPEELLKMESPNMADWLEAFIPIDQHVLVRFGKWEEILEQELPEDRELYCVTTAVMRYARAIALATLGRTDDAVAEAQEFDRAYDLVPDTRYQFNNPCRDILAIAQEMMRGEIAYRQGDFDAAFAHLRHAVELDDHLHYDEPWGWMQPVRHALGALLLEQDRVEEALAVYQADLGYDANVGRPRQHLDNVWALAGYTECLERTNQPHLANVARQRLTLAQARADTEIQSSCFCRLDLDDACCD